MNQAGATGSHRSWADPVSVLSLPHLHHPQDCNSVQALFFWDPQISMGVCRPHCHSVSCPRSPRTCKAPHAQSRPPCKTYAWKRDSFTDWEAQRRGTSLGQVFQAALIKPAPPQQSSPGSLPPHPASHPDAPSNGPCHLSLGLKPTMPKDRRVEKP